MKPHSPTTPNLSAGFIGFRAPHARALNVVGVYDQARPRPVLVMEYVPGRTFREVIEADAPLVPRTALDLLDLMLQARRRHEAGLSIATSNRRTSSSAPRRHQGGRFRPGPCRDGNGHLSQRRLSTLSYIAPEQVELEATTRPMSTPRADPLELLTGRGRRRRPIPNVPTSISTKMSRHHSRARHPPIGLPAAHATTKAPARRPRTPAPRRGSPCPGHPRPSRTGALSPRPGQQPGPRWFRFR